MKTIIHADLVWSPHTAYKALCPFTLPPPSLPELGLDEGREGDEVEDEVDDEGGGGEDQADGQVEPAVQQLVEGVALVPLAVALLKVVGAVNVSAEGRKMLFDILQTIFLQQHSNWVKYYVVYVGICLCK